MPKGLRAKSLNETIVNSALCLILMLADLNEKDISAKLSLCAYSEIRLVYTACLLGKSLKSHILVIHQGSSEKRQSSTGRCRVHTCPHEWPGYQLMVYRHPADRNR